MKVQGLESRVEGQKRGVALRSHSGSQPSTLDPRPSFRGMTLVELLIVIVIITTLVAAAIPLMSPTNDGRRLREAARGLNTYITGAQSRAVAAHRPFGIALKRLSYDTNTNPNKDTDPTKDIHPDNGACLEVFYVEQPAPYAGFDANSRACVALHPNKLGLVLVRFVTRGNDYPSNGDRLPIGWDPDLFPNGMIRPADVIEINGTQFELLAPSEDMYEYVILDDNGYFQSRGGFQSRAAVTIVARPINDSGQQINPKYDNTGYTLGADREAAAPAKPPAPFWTNPAPYKVLRQATRASDEPYQLPEGTAIDLRASGVGANDYFYVPGFNDNHYDVLIMFTPEGRVSRVSYSQLPLNNREEPPMFDQNVVDNVYLLVGRRTGSRRRMQRRPIPRSIRRHLAHLKPQKKWPS